MEAPKTRIEKPSEFGARRYGYTVLKDVRFNSEPVVPRIVRDSKEGPMEVEELGGTDLLHLLADQKISDVDKLDVFDAVVGQLQVIDKAGFVIFDRNFTNVLIESWGKQGISIRQIDIEYIYNKLSGAIYTDKPNSAVVAKAEYCKRNQINQWCDVVFDLAVIVKHNFDDTMPEVLEESFIEKYRKMSLYAYSTGELKQNEINTSDVLSILKNDIKKLRDIAAKRR